MTAGDLALAPAGRRLATLVAGVFLPFVAGYFLSYLFRTVNALIAPDLMRDLGVGPAGIGFLTSAYFLTFATLQLPLGVLLDRHGPRRVQAPLMVIAALGALLFAMGHATPTLLVGRALIGAGVAGSLVAGLKAIATWFPKERLSLANGWFVMLGTCGAIASTRPSAMVVDAIGWRGLFVVLALACLAIGAVIWLSAPDRPPAAQAAAGGPPPGLRAIYADRRFLRIAPLSACCISAVWAIQGLWAGRWLAEVTRLDPPAVVNHLFVMACALSTGALLIGVMGDRLRRWGVAAVSVFGWACFLLMLIEVAILAQARVPSYALWGAFAVFGGLTVASFAIVGEIFPKESVGRANGALNILHIGGAFLLQSAMGAVLELWPSDAAGQHPLAAYQAAFALPFLLQVASFVWFLANRGAARAVRRASIQSV